MRDASVASRRVLACAVAEELERLKRAREARARADREALESLRQQKEADELRRRLLVSGHPEASAAGWVGGVGASC